MKLKILIVFALLGCLTFNASAFKIGNLIFDKVDATRLNPESYAYLQAIDGEIETLEVPIEVEYDNGYTKKTYPVRKISISGNTYTSEKYKRYRQTLKKIVAPSVVEVYGFDDCELLEEAEFSGDIISISGFKGCAKLKKNYYRR